MSAFIEHSLRTKLEARARSEVDAVVKHQAAMQVSELPVNVGGATHALVTDDFFSHMKAFESKLLF